MRQVWSTLVQLTCSHDWLNHAAIYGRKSAKAGKRSAQRCSSRVGELRGSAGERPCSSCVRAPRAIRRRRRAAGDMARARRVEWQDGGRLGTPPRARGMQNGAGGFAWRREQGEGVSRSRTRRGASEARRAAATLRGAPHSRVDEGKHAPIAERACGGTGDVTPALARRAATRSARVGAAQQRCAACGRGGGALARA